MNLIDKLPPKAKKLFYEYEFWIVFAGSVLLGLIFYFNPFTKDFGVNILTEIASIWFTVLLVNRIIEKREKKRRVAIDQRIITETLTVIASFFSIWKHLVWKYHPLASIKNEKDFLNTFPELIESCRLSDKFELVSTHYPESWNLFFHDLPIRNCFKNYNETMRATIQSLIDNFKIHLEPELLGMLLEILESQYMREVTSIYDDVDTELVLTEFGKDTDKLSSYLNHNSHILEKMFELNRYCENLISSISSYTDQNFKRYKLEEYFKNPTRYA